MNRRPVWALVLLLRPSAAVEGRFFLASWVRVTGLRACCLKDSVAAVAAALRGMFAGGEAAGWVHRLSTSGRGLPASLCEPMTAIAALRSAGLAMTTAG